MWAVAKGSLVNKAILVPSALAISAFAPGLVTPLLMIGGAFLCYEGFEKLAHRFLHSPEEDAARVAELADALVDPPVDMVAIEKDKIKGAIRTDFVLSAEIIAITLGTVADRVAGDAVRRAREHRPDHDRGRLRLRRRDRQARRRRAGAQPPRRCVLAGRSAGRSSPARRS